MSTWYYVHRYGPRISVLRNVIKETASTVTYESGDRKITERKTTSYTQLYPTFLEARVAAIERLQKNIESWEKQIKTAQELITRLSIADAESIEKRPEDYR